MDKLERFLAGKYAGNRRVAEAVMPLEVYNALARIDEDPRPRIMGGLTRTLADDILRSKDVSLTTDESTTDTTKRFTASVYCLSEEEFGRLVDDAFKAGEQAARGEKRS